MDTLENLFPFERSNVKLGQGGNGEVYLGRHIYSKELVALKKCYLRSSNSSSQTSPVLTAMTEAAIVSRDEAFQRLLVAPGEHVMLALYPHPHVVTILGCCSASPCSTYLALALQDSDLRFEISAGTTIMREDVAKLVMFPVLSAVAFLHDKHVAHRDIKPHNIFLRRNRTTVLGADVCLGDFGQAHHVGGSLRGCEGTIGGCDINGCDPAATGEQQRVVIPACGTYYYQSPELLRGHGVPPHGAFMCDMWALGCTLYELLTGVAAFSGDTQMKVINMVHKRMGTDYSSFPNIVATPTLLDDIALCSAECKSLLSGLLQLDPECRLSAQDAMRHPFFRGVEAMTQMRFEEPVDALDGGLNSSGGGCGLGLPLMKIKGFPVVDPDSITFRPVIVERAAPRDDDCAPATTVGGGRFVRNMNLSDASSVHLSREHDATVSRMVALDTSAQNAFAYSNMRTTALFGDMSGQSSSGGGGSGSGLHHQSPLMNNGYASDATTPPRAAKALAFDRTPSPPPPTATLYAA